MGQDVEFEDVNEGDLLVFFPGSFHFDRPPTDRRGEVIAKTSDDVQLRCGDGVHVLRRVDWDDLRPLR
jgi:hypothetical protein